MPISDRLLQRRYTEALNGLCLHVHMGAELPQCVTKQLVDVLDHPHASDAFFVDNVEALKSTIVHLVEYIDSLQRPHSFIKQAQASPTLPLMAKNGTLREMGIALLPPTATVTIHVDDAGTHRYTTIHTAKEA